MSTSNFTEKPAYGGVWQNATTSIAALLELDLPAGDRLRRILELGYFTQLTSYPLAAFNAAVVTWLEEHLAFSYGFDLANLPIGLAELDIAPSATVSYKAGRALSPDLLRYVAYVQEIQRVWRNDERKAQPQDVLEIGSGYGGLVRTLKCFYPQARFWLTDIPESLRCAEIYLREAFPTMRIAWLDGDVNEPVPDADFCFVPVAEVDRLSGRKFDLAINVWSFGEMPNAYVNRWLKLLQHDCQVDWLFAINSFMAPVTPASVLRTQVGDWLFGLDDRWSVEHFAIDPQVHRCSLIRNFPKGVGLVARRLSDESDILPLRVVASQEASVVLVEDWAAIAATEEASAEPGRPERKLEASGIAFDPKAISSRRLCALTDYIGHFNIEHGMDGDFFRLWNDYRMNRNERSGALLVAYLAMVGKSDLERRCTKEELLLLKRLPELPLHQEYAAFGAAIQRGKVSHSGVWLSDQEACDRALEHKKAGEFEAAELLWAKVAEAYPAHGDCWFQLALLAEIRCDSACAAIFSAHSVYLGCSYYATGAGRLKASFLNSHQVAKKEAPASLLSRWLTQLKTEPQVVASGSADVAASFGRLYFSGDTAEALAGLAQWQRLTGNEVIAHAIEQAIDSAREIPAQGQTGA